MTVNNEQKHSKDTIDDVAEQPIEQHPFAPVLPKDATIMMMGTFPPTEDKWAMPFHYPNFYNDMWRIYGEVFFADPDHFRVGDEKRFEPQRIIDFMHERGIASCPTVRSAIRERQFRFERGARITGAFGRPWRRGFRYTGCSDLRASAKWFR